MKTRLFLVLPLLMLPFLGFMQTHSNIGIGYYGESISHPGIVLEFELEKFHSESFSLPMRADLAYFHTPDYQVVFLDIHYGFRKYFASGIFLEQSLGIGLMSTFYDVESIYYIDTYGNWARYYDGANLGVMPSVSIGIGYDLSKDVEKQNAIWIRPKVYWNLGFRSIAYPYAAVQVGFTHTFKTSQK